MKKIILSTMVFIFFFIQKTQAQKIGIGFNAGATMAQLTAKSGNTSNNSDWHPGFCAGVVTDIILKAPFSFQPGLNFLQKGGKNNQTLNGTDYKFSAVLNYLELPLNFTFRSKGEKDHFIAGIGPSLAYCLSGKAKMSAGGVSSSYNYKIGNSATDDIKPFDIGGSLMAGYESSTGIFVTFSFNKGFNNLATDGQATGKSNYFSLKIGYLIRGKK